jgi:hypothetical protein
MDDYIDEREFVDMTEAELEAEGIIQAYEASEDDGYYDVGEDIAIENPIHEDHADAGSPKGESNCIGDESGQTNCTPPEKPDGKEPSMVDTRPDESDGIMTIGELDPRHNDGSLHPVAYLAIGAFSIILGTIVSYVIFSRFFHRRPYETFSSKGKFFGFIGVAVAIAALVIVLAYFMPIWTRG